MKTTQADYKTDIALLAKENMAGHVQLVLVMAGMIGLAAAILGILVRL